LDQDDWDLSPDGSKIAISSSGESDGRIRILALSGEATAELNIKGHSGFQSMDWSADGRGLYVSSRTAWGANLLYIDLEGNTKALRQQIGSFATWGLPSPDGKHLAFLEWTAAGNAWMMEGF